MVRAFSIALLTTLTLWPAAPGRAQPAPAELGSGAVGLTDQGQPTARIVIAAQPTRYAQIAALELQHYLEKISGARLPITTDQLPHAGDGYAVLVGPSQLTAQLGYHPQDFAKDEYLIETRGTQLILMGRDHPQFGWVTHQENGHWPGFWPESSTNQREIYQDHATLWAVYHFLEKYCGVRWFMLTELGTVIPSHPTINAANIYLRRRPWAQLRRFNINGFTDPFHYHDSPDGPKEIHLTGPGHQGWRKLFMWLERQRFGGALHECTHSLYSYFDRFGPDHPDWFAHGRAVYGSQMCYTNPGLIQQVARDINHYFDGAFPENRYPDLDRAYWIAAAGNFHAVVPMDNDDYCTCPRCRDQWTPGQDWMFFGGHRSNYVWNFVNQVARLVRPHHPDRWISALAYYQYTTTPDFPQ